MARRGTPIRTALVLGGGSDIAVATLDALADDGLQRAVLAVRDRTSVRAARVDERVACSLVEWDATDVTAHEALVEQAVAELGRIDLVLCAVGMLGHHAGLTMGPEDVELMHRTNCAGPAAALAAAAPVLVSQGGGAIVVLSSVAGVRPRRSNYVYGSSKAGLDSFARGLGDAVRSDGVDVTTVRPGFVVSSMTEGLDPAPFATDPDTVAAAITQRLRRGGGGVLWVPPLLGPMFAVLSNAPAGVWRRIAGDR